MQGLLQFFPVLLVVLLSTETCHAAGAVAGTFGKRAQARPSASATGEEEVATREEGSLPELVKEGKEDDENEENSEPSAEGEEADALQTDRTNARAPSAQNSELAEDEEKQRELARRVRELLSRLPIIPLSQTPTLQKVTLDTADNAFERLAPAPDTASDESAADASTASPAAPSVQFPAPPVPPVSSPLSLANPSPAPSTSAPLVPTPATVGEIAAPAAAALAAFVAAPFLFEKSSADGEALAEKLWKAAPGAAPGTTPPYGGSAATQPLSANANTARPENTRVRYWPPSSAAGSADTAGGRQPQPGEPQGSGVDDGQPRVTPAEFAPSFDFTRAVNALARWLENVKQELSANGALNRLAEENEEEAEAEEQDSQRAPAEDDNRQAPAVGVSQRD